MVADRSSDLISDLVAAWPYRGADRCPSGCIPQCLHRLETGSHDSGRQSSPPGVQNGNRSIPLDDDWHAVCRRDSEWQSRPIGDQAIGRTGEPRLVHRDDHPPVYLPDEGPLALDSQLIGDERTDFGVVPAVSGRRVAEGCSTESRGSDHPWTKPGISISSVPSP